MAQSVSKSHSPRRVARYARRHQRLTNRTKKEQAVAVAARIDAPAAELEARNADVDRAQRTVEDKFDDWCADDAVVDETIEAIGRKSKDYDAENPGSRTYATIFHGKNPSDITSTNRAEQPDEVVKIIERISAVPADHPALPLATTLTESNEQARTSHKAYLDAQTALVQAKSAAEIAKLKVVQVYRDNIIDMVRAVGERLAERCFPQVRKPRKKKSSTSDDES